MTRVFHKTAAGVCLLVLAMACRGPNEPAPGDALTGSLASAHFDFRFADGDTVDAPRQEAFHDWIVPELALATFPRLQYNKYRDRGHLERVTGQSTNGFAEPASFTVHSIWPWDAHEAVHVYTALIGRPSDFFNEGIAVALSFDPLANRFVSLWNNTPIDQIARDLQRAGTLPSMTGMADTDAFRRLSDQTSYPVAGSFVGFVLRERGAAAMRAFFEGGARLESLSAIQSRFTAVFGWSLAEADQRWRAYLAGL